MTAIQKAIAEVGYDTQDMTGSQKLTINCTVAANTTARMPVNPPRPPAARMKNHANTWAIAQEKIVAKTARCVQTIRHAKRKVAARWSFCQSFLL